MAYLCLWGTGKFSSGSWVTFYETTSQFAQKAYDQGLVFQDHGPVLLDSTKGFLDLAERYVATRNAKLKSSKRDRPKVSDWA